MGRKQPILWDRTHIERDKVGSVIALPLEKALYIYTCTWEENSTAQNESVADSAEASNRDEWLGREEQLDTDISTEISHSIPHKESKGLT